MNVPSEVIRLLRNGVTIGHMATSFRNQPHVTPAWLDYDPTSGQLIIDLESASLKLKHVMVNPHIAISFVSADDSSHWVSLKGLVIQIEDMGDDVSHLQSLALRYLGRHKGNPGRRFILSIKIGSVRWWGGDSDDDR
jgi:hypothetical protein